MDWTLAFKLYTYLYEFSEKERLLLYNHNEKFDEIFYENRTIIPLDILVEIMYIASKLNV